VLEESIKHTVGVSKDLREGVRLSIEVLANEVVRRRASAGLPPLGRANHAGKSGPTARKQAPNTGRDRPG